jgi:16S rRNA (guanine527-N7)-methyltransferase
VQSNLRSNPTASAQVSATIAESELCLAAAELGLELSAGQAQQLAAFGQLLLRWNAVHNLTAVRAPADVMTHHLLDSLAVVPELERLTPARQLRLLDVGSGGGLPAIPLAIACARAMVTALDAVEKKCAFMLQARAELGLAQFTVVHGRVEAYAAEPFDIITARAFSSLAELVRLSEHLLRPDGLWLAMKGQIPLSELAALPRDVRHVATVKLRVPRLDQQRHLIVLAPCPRPERCDQPD